LIPVRNPQGGILRIRNLPDLPKVEDRLRLYETGRNLSAESEVLLDQFCRANFGIGLTIDFPWPKNFDDLPPDEQWEIENLVEEFDAMFETNGASPEEAAAILLKYQIDFTDEYGRPLLCTEHLMRPVEVAAKGIQGKIPNPIEVDAGKWEASLEKQAAKFKAERRPT
jgi:hypothetical protein